MPQFYALILACVLIALAVIVHFQALQMLSAVQNRPGAPGHGRILAIIFGLTAAHVVEAVIFALGYWAGEQAFHLGGFAGSRPMGVMHFFYFSLETFTTQGVGDVYAVGPLRLVASLEPLVGLMLLGWSTSFTFLAMGRDWRLRARRAVAARGGRAAGGR
ncbi:potassium transporter Kef [Caulobacter sp. CCUG 60055]|uniref:ion channel n=1 Tax=Caulobacter sp. CCUG 60055 TaxID=2100090 RepID=UPI001FA743F9|nr:ion channel [Caulobacter sp. CCUG 60055]MCI3180873.1 potassium transporter Kef [Caulobacter sp. CCUG 60055]